MAQPPTNPNDWVAITAALGGIIAGLGGVFTAIASYVKLGARVERIEATVEANDARTVKRLDEADGDIESLKLNEREGSAKREAMHALLEESRRDIKQILATVAQLAAQHQANQNRDSK